MFVPTRSVEGKIEKIQFSRISNSKFVIISLEKYKLCPKNDGVLMVILQHLQGIFYSRGILLYKQHTVHWGYWINELWIDLTPGQNV